ncbi:glycoside hydrolase family protein [Kineosporia sp. NBRC 101731]|uniref:glycoside hydrolase family protein n=1 Tax=Kineosporia sp. NBRC 101731 TaxID=3032199 RepID=UPI0024A399E0|nr:glycoside hydrolase family protein [Kineosporia sp. NBRC 101731]GLY28571.1 hypothetical protein Kisp02_19360 [Kineosporia sp. NBRC 101731]
MTRRNQRLVGIIAAIALVMGGFGYLGLRSRSSNANAAQASLVAADLPQAASTTTSSAPTATSTASADALKKKAAAARKRAKALRERIARARKAAATKTPTAAPTPTTGTGTGSGPDTVGSVKKGAALWKQDSITASLKDSGVSWFYNWSPEPQGVSAPAGVDFVPMIWGADSVTSANLAAAQKNGNTLLGFNEPDLGEQSNMTVEKALELWPQLEDTGMRLGSPAVAWGADQDGQWLDKFMAGAKTKGYDVDFITLHWYGSDFTSANATAQLKSYIEAVHRKYGKPIWLTEYSLMNFAAGAQKFPSAANQAEFVTSSTKMLESLSYVEHYSWFAFPTSTNGQDETGLYRPDGSATQPGEAYRVAG